ncbi:MAG TPA: glycosyltransferase family 1 protein [Acidimicrobiales bacterium]|nr:glycosyltransferase family 1 protein [Acidimicrobiales bacterium]
MRVAVVVEQCWHRVPGGTAGAVIDQVAAVAVTGRVEQIGVAARHTRPPAEPWRPAIPVRHLPLPRAALYRTWHRWRRPSVERATGPIDVVHATGYAIPPRPPPLVVTMHDLAWRRDPSMFTANGVRFFEAGLRCVVADADLVLCPSHATLEDCAAAGIEDDRLRHVPWGMDGGSLGEVTEAEVARVRRAHGLDGRYVLSVGTLEPRKNLPGLLDAFARLMADGGGRHADVTLAVVGPAGWGESLSEPVARLGDRVRTVGFVPRGDLAPLYRGAAVVCYPSLWEGYGLPVAEALAAGAPVVTSAGTATEELVTGGAGLAVDPRDPDAIAGALARVLDDDDLADRLRRAARKRAAESTWATTAALTIAAYDEAAGG